MDTQIRAGVSAGSEILALGVSRPSRVVTNSEICEKIHSTPEWIEARSGIISRHHARPEETLLSLAVDAGEKALADAGITAAELGCVIVASMSNLVQTPPLSIAVAHELGAAGTGGFDLAAGCAGFCHALGLASTMVSTGEADYVLVVGTERMTDIVDPADRTIAFLFADGAGAVVVGRCERTGIGPTVRGADGGSLDALRMTNSWAGFREDPTSAAPYMIMDGKRVFRWAATELANAARHAMTAAGVSPEQIAVFIPHQANLRLIKVLVDHLDFRPEVVIADDVIHSGNTSAASIPLAMDRLMRTGRARSGDLALLIAFGAGLNYAAQVVRLP